MIKLIYGIIIGYFVLGGIGFYFINRNKEKQVAKKSYTKFVSYFVIIHILFFSIVVNPVYFKYLSLIIITAGFIELFSLFYKNRYQKLLFYLVSNIVYIILSLGFFVFSGLPKEIILFSFLVLSIFDSFSQITGQLWGKTKLFPSISPAKTLGGTVGGGMVAIASSLLLNDLYQASVFNTMSLALGIIVFAQAGDLLASVYKRKFKVKDYNQIIPGHGGFLDRFDSLIAGGAWVALGIYILNF
ncbi:phosphatidate cytidylyltransferase [Saccharicrinis carchari]|uniref:Phosphatidate cytidylyltransferase n=1 Tax=Saccharicrinis carchari TaxID=1168039 RepID=A0A521B3J2_SACCC|nr:phosphatidate cytidylyltransferase [Saccharicrinis carchari]SMO41616.1 phosphatidate cytidylyltransferase [Saccharicrinis carchari]